MSADDVENPHENTNVNSYSNSNSNSNEVKRGSGFDKRYLLLLGTTLFFGCTTLALLMYGQFFSPLIHLQEKREQDWVIYKNLASKLSGISLDDKAAESLKMAISTRGDFQDEKMWPVIFSLGELYEKMGKNEEAIAYFSLVENLTPSGSDLNKQAQRSTVALLEKIGKSSQAQMVLNAATQLTGQQNQSGEVIAVIGEQKYYLNDFNEALNYLPEEMKSNLKDKTAKQQFLRKYLADKILLEKAKRLNWHQETTYLNQVKLIEEQLLVQKVLKSEIIDKLKMDDMDLKNYFEKNQEQITKMSGQKKVKWEDVKDLVKDLYGKEKMTQEYQKMIQELLSSQKVEIYDEKIQ